MKTLEELKVIRDSMAGEVALRTHGNAASKYERHVLVCGGTGCTSSGSRAIQEEFVSQIEKNDLENEIKIVQTEIGRAHV